MRLNTILIALGAALALSTAAPAFGWSQGWDWDEDFNPTPPVLNPMMGEANGPLLLQPAELDALAEPLCVEGAEPGTCTIHA